MLLQVCLAHAAGPLLPAEIDFDEPIHASFMRLMPKLKLHACWVLGSSTSLESRHVRSLMLSMSKHTESLTFLISCYTGPCHAAPMEPAVLHTAGHEHAPYSWPSGMVSCIS